MNARNKKFLSMILAMFLVLQFLPFNTFAADGEVQMSGREAVDYALFSASRESALLLNGSRISIKGDVHTNADFVYQGSELVIDGACEASGKVSAKNAKALITKEIECAPIIEMSDYTTEIKTIASENAEIFEADQKYHGNSIVFEKSIIANGSIFVNGSKFTTNDYIIATKDISINVAKSEIGFKNGSVICSETGNITFNGSEVNIKGIIYAPKGTVTINSGIFTLKGRILANKIIFRGITLNVQSNKEDIDLIYRETDIIFDQIRNEYECNIEHKISFTIVDKFGKPVPNVICSISVTGNATAPSSVTTNSDGRATIVISDSMNESITLTITTKKGLSKSIVLNFVKNQAIINLYIVDNNNLPVSGAQITVLSLDSAADNASKVFYSNEQGIADFSLPEGNYTFKIGKDNYKQVIYEKISLTAGNVYSNTIILQELLNEIFVQYKTILTNQPVKNRISVKVLYEKNQLRSETQNSTPVELFMMNASGEWLSKGFLFDNGNLSINGDEIKADQVYTNIFDFNETQQGKLRLKIVVYRADGTQISKEFSIEVIEPLPDVAFQTLIDVNNYVREYIQSYFTSNVNTSVKELANLLKLELSGDDRIKEVNVVNDSLEITLTSGLKLYVLITENSSTETMVRGSGSFQQIDLKPESDCKIIDFNYDFTLSKDILLWAPFDTKWGEADETRYVEEIVNSSPYGYKLDIVRDTEANVESLRDVTKYGMIIFATHGHNGQWLVTGEKLGENIKYKIEQQKDEVGIFTIADIDNKNSETYYAVSNKWFENNLSDRFAKSIIVNNSCYSTATDLLWNAFAQRGACAYFGYSDKVTNECIVINSVHLLTEIILNGRCTVEAYVPTLDTYYNDNGMFQIKGQANLKMPYGLINGSFENDLIGWQTDGDGRATTGLGFVKPTDGSKMGIISTGLGYTLEHGELKQRIFIPEYANKLIFDWNVLSEEFLEWIGSRYDDPFVVTITLEGENGQEVKILDLDINKIASMFNATETNGGNLIKVSPEIVFDKGDVWMTDWQTTEFDVTPFRGQNAVLKFSVKDAVDTIYTTAVLIDNIRFDVNYGYSGRPVEVDPLMFSKDFSRGIFNNTKGISYIFYDPKNFKSQAEFARKWVRFKNGYKSIEQVKAIQVETEEVFVREWNNMRDEGIDNVILFFHGKYYAIMINNDRDVDRDNKTDKENLTVNPDGKTLHDDLATEIRKLKEKKIKELVLLSCNNGLLDAIDTKATISEKDKKLVTLGNVAQAFLETQNVEKVEGFDGSLSFFGGTCFPRIALDQSSFYEQLEQLENYKRHKNFPRPVGLSYNPFGIKVLPVGKVIYFKDRNGKTKCSYKCDKFLVEIEVIGNYDGKE